ncbi:MAG: helix-hairpin-helix domain-containing protein [Bacteroidales bacterium]|nr:helix-hairpin-helix domain-containing protein [Bacteroidales bacterium]
MRLRNNLNALFAYSRSEIRGIIILILIICVLLFVRYEIRSRAEPLILDEQEYTHQINNTYNTNRPESDSIISMYNSNSLTTDPNTATYHELVTVGFSSEISNRIIKYRETGGCFNSTDDLLKVYGFDRQKLEVLRKHIIIKSARKSIYPGNESITKCELIEINSADTAEFMQLAGIGKVLSARIIKYRSVLGGFYNTKQLIEVFGIDDSLYTTISNRLIADTLAIQKININLADFNDLKAHPYITYNQAKAILSYRRIMGQFNQVNELLKFNLLSEENYLKVLPYLSF